MLYDRNKMDGPKPRPFPPQKPHEYEVLAGEVTKLTDRAVLFVQYTSNMVKIENWIPRSQIRNGANVQLQDKSLSVTQWFLKKENIQVPGKTPKA